MVVSVTDDSVNEPREQFSAGLEILTPGVGGTIHLIPDSATISISDDDGQFVVSNLSFIFTFEIMNIIYEATIKLFSQRW